MNITYLLGAGASANCLPVINELPIRLRHLRDELRANSVNFPEDIDENLLKCIDEILIDIESHTTIDTLAKKYYLTGKLEKLKRLKKVLITYFQYEQSFIEGIIRKSTLKEVPDKRYDSFIATIIDNHIKNLSLPNNFKIITWNYDIQFELAYQEYLNDKTHLEIQKVIQAIPSTEFISDEFTPDINKFMLIRLNGIAGCNKSLLDKGKALKFQDTFSRGKFLNAVKDFFLSLPEEDIKLLNYSWEKNEEFELAHNKLIQIQEIAKKIMFETNILVIIGYSFPLFNRSVDKELVCSLQSHLVKNIYIQDTPERAKEMKDLIIDSFENLQQMNEESPHKIKEVSYTGQFFIPPQTTI